MSRRAWVLLALLAATWGASYMFIKVALRDLPAPTIVCARVALGALVLAPVVRHQRVWSRLAGRWRHVVVLAAVQVVAPFLLITFGERHIASALAGILVAAAPIFTLLLAPYLDAEERSSGWAMVGVLMGMVGVALLFGVDLTGSAEEALGGAMVLLAALGYALGAMYLKRTLRDVPSSAVACSTMLVSALMTAPLVAVDPPDGVRVGPLAALLTLGVVGTGAAFLVFYFLIASEGPARASLVAYLAPAFAVGYGALALNEHIGAATVAGLVLVLAGSWLGAGGRRTPQPASRTAPSHSSSPEPARAR